MRFAKVSTKTLRQQVYDQLRGKIISAGVLPGETLRLRGLADEFGVSLMPVREALWQLESEKIVLIESNKRIQVNTLTQQEMKEILQIRLLLESMAADRSCELRPDSAILKAKALLEQMFVHIQRSTKRYLMANSAFHSTIYSYSDSPVLMRFIDLLWAREGPYFNLLALKGQDLAPTLKYHEGMYEAWVERDKDKMRRFLKQDLTDAANAILSFLESPD